MLLWRTWCNAVPRLAEPQPRLAFKLDCPWRPPRCRAFEPSRQFDSRRSHIVHWTSCVGAWLQPWNVARAQVSKCSWAVHAEVWANHQPRLSGQAARSRAPDHFSSVSRMFRVEPWVVGKVHSESEKRVAVWVLMDKLTAFSKGAE